jgi:signal transduction histidine kinase/DNA-binding response OmpR family regulator
MDAESILIVDDESSIREVLRSILQDAGCRTLDAGTAEEGLELMNDAAISVAMIDLKLPGMGGIDLLGEIKRRSPSTEVIIMTSYASLETAIEAIRREAYDYIQKPFEDLDQPWTVVRRALEKRDLTRKNRELVNDLERKNRDLAAAVKRQNSLIDAGRAMSGILAISDLLDFFIGVAADVLDVERASLMLVDEKSNEMQIAAHRGLNDEVARKVRLKVGEGIAGWVALEGKPILVKDVESDPRIHKPLASTSAGSFISAPIVLSIPILIQQKVLGVINVTNRRSGASFGEEDMAFLHSLASQAAVAIERARHFEDLQEAYQSLKDTQTDLVESERINAVGQLAAGVAHDFNNLLTGMLGQAELLQMDLAGSPPAIEASRKKAELLETLALQGAAVVRRMQDFARIRKDTPSGAVDLNVVMRNAVEVTQGKWKDECLARGVEVNVRMEPGKIPLTEGNDSELTQVVSNLIFNAVEALSGGGEIVLATQSDGKDIRLTVTDNGVGMPAEVQQKIFEPFFTTKEFGQGLGMSVIYGIVARHRGEITVHSEKKKGTTIELRLPVIAPAAKKWGTDREKAVPVGPASVLVVDDSDLNRALFEGYLVSLGHKVRLAGNGQEALSIFEREGADLVITDLSMPGLSGWQVAEGVKKQNPNVPVILVSGWAIQQDEPRIRDSGVDRVLQKPCSIAKFQEAVQETLRHAGKRGNGAERERAAL